MKKHNAGKSTVHLCWLSSAVADLKKGERTEENVLAILKDDPKICNWDLSENPWLCALIARLLKSEQLKEEAADYPWHKYNVI